MHVDFLLGPAGSGKTFRCLAEIRAALAAAPEGLPLVFLAPKQATFQLERELLEDSHLPGYTRLQILSFERLAEFILNQFFAAPPRVLSEEGRVMVLRALLARHGSELKIFHASARLPGFARQLSQLLNELQQHRLSPKRLLKLCDESAPAAQLSDKLRDVALLLQTYFDWLQKNELQDPTGLLEVAAAVVKEAARESRFRLGGLWLDGFAELTSQELDLLGALIPSCERVTLAFCLDGAPEQGDEWHSMWATTSRTFLHCKQHLEILPGFESKTEVLERHSSQSRFAASPQLAHLERFWVLPRPFPNLQLTHQALNQNSNFSARTLLHDPSSIHLYACPNLETEAIMAAREILRHVRQNGGRFRDVAVLVRSFVGYDAVLGRVFTRYNIPFFVDRREPVSHHPLAELTRYALRGLVSDWDHDDWFGALKTGLVHANEGMIDFLENLSLARGWRGNAWIAPFDMPGEPELQQKLEKIRQELVPPFSRFAATLSAVQRQPTGLELAAAIRRLWGDLRVGETLERWSEASTLKALPEIHQQTWAEMDNWLDNLELAFEHTPLPLGDWIPVVEAGLANLSAGMIPPALDEVLIGEVERSRNPNLEVVLLLGMNETVFPAAPQPAVLLNDYDRETLAVFGLTLGSSQRDQIGRERLLGYIACTRARRRVVLTYTQRDGKDKPLNPSPFIHHLQRLFPGLEAESVTGASDWRESIHASELVVPILRNKVQIPTSKIQSLAALETLPAFSSVLARFEQIATSHSVKHLSSGQAQKLYGPNLETSISALEDYAACPFKFFVVAGLRAKEREEFEVDRRERGSFQHEILMEFHRHVQGHGLKWRELTPTNAAELIGKLGAEVQSRFRDGLFSSSPERRFDARTLIEGLQQFIEVLVRWAPQYLFEPQAVEISFGMEEGGLKPWRIDLSQGGSLLLRGRIDRVDLQRQPNGEAYAVVIDYKSGGKELEQIKMVNGLDLQLLAYLGVLRDTSNALEVLGGSRLAPAGAFYVGLRSVGGSGKTRGEVLENRQQARQTAYQHRGRFRGDLLRAFDNRDDSRGDQFRYSLKNDGTFAQMGNEAMPEADFLGLVVQVEDFLRQYGQSIYAGDVRIEPYRHKNEKACDHCDYASICRFDPWVESYRVLK